MSERIVKRRVPIHLTEKELVEYGNQAGQIHSRLAQVRFEAKNASETFKNKMAGFQDDLSEIMTKIRDKKEMRDVECIEVKDFQNQVVNYLFNGEVVDSRMMSTDEMQDSFL